MEADDAGYEIQGRKKTMAASLLDYAQNPTRSYASAVKKKPLSAPLVSIQPDYHKVNVDVPSEDYLARLRSTVDELPDDELQVSTMALSGEERDLYDSGMAKLPSGIFIKPNCHFDTLREYVSPVTFKKGNTDFFLKLCCQGLERNGKDWEGLDEDSIGHYLAWLAKQNNLTYRLIRAWKKVTDFRKEVERISKSSVEELRQKKMIAVYQKELNKFDDQVKKSRLGILNLLIKAQSDYSLNEDVKTQTIVAYATSLFRSDDPNSSENDEQQDQCDSDVESGEGNQDEGSDEAHDDSDDGGHVEESDGESGSDGEVSEDDLATDQSIDFEINLDEPI